MFITLALLSAATAVCVYTHKSTKRIETECSDYFWTYMDQYKKQRAVVDTYREPNKE